MAAAEVGDDVLGDDPTVLKLEDEAARRTGKEAALFVPSGSMANLIAQLVWTRRGDEVIVGQDSHVVIHEVGSGAAIAGIQFHVVPGDGLLDAGEVESRIEKRTFHTPGTGLVSVENTHNMAGGMPYELERLRGIGAVCRRNGVPLHLDGARVFNAAVALGVDVATIAAEADSVSFCLSKGLGAPVGSVLCGTRDFRTEALRFRKMLGGGMRQAGILAAAGLYALAHHVERLAEDHAAARRLAEAIAGHPKAELDPARVRTNILMIGVEGVTPDEMAARCERDGLCFLARDGKRVRLVTHLDVAPQDIDRAARIFTSHLR